MDHLRVFYRVGSKTEVMIGPVLGRKSLGLMVKQGSVLYTLAYFRNEDSAKKFIEALQDLTLSRASEEERS